MFEASGGEFNSRQREFNIWNRYCGLLNEFFYCQSMSHPCGVARWIKGDVEKSGYVVKHGLLYGSASLDCQNNVYVGTVTLPNDADPIGNGQDSQTHIKKALEEMTQIVMVNAIFSVEGVVTDAAAMPHRSTKIATSSSGDYDVLLFDTSASFDGTKLSTEPTIRLRGNAKVGGSLSWNQIFDGLLICPSDKCSICLWDVNRPSENCVLDANVSFVHNSAIQAVCWHRLHQTLFGSVDEDLNLVIWDTRFNSKNKPIMTHSAHQQPVSSLDFSPFNEFLIATGSADETVAIWDLRNLSARVHALKGVSQSGAVTQVAWSPFCESMIASISKHPSVQVWDLSLIGDQQSPQEKADGPPELFFVQGSHRSEVTSVSWNEKMPSTLCSTAGDALHIFRIANSIIAEV